MLSRSESVVALSHPQEISGSFTHAGNIYEVKIRYHNESLKNLYGPKALEELNAKIKLFIKKLETEKLTTLSGYTVRAFLDGRNFILLKEGKKLDTFGSREREINTIRDRFREIFKPVKPAKISATSPIDITFVQSKEETDTLKEIVDAWMGEMEERNVLIPNDPESHSLLDAAATLVKTCIDTGHEPTHTELKLEHTNLRKALRDLIAIACSYYQKWDFHSSNTDEKKARFLNAISDCMRGSLNNWERGLSIFSKCVWEDREEYHGIADKIIKGTYEFSDGIDSEGYEFDWE